MVMLLAGAGDEQPLVADFHQWRALRGPRQVVSTIRISRPADWSPAAALSWTGTGPPRQARSRCPPRASSGGTARRCRGRPRSTGRNWDRSERSWTVRSWPRPVPSRLVYRDARPAHPPPTTSRRHRAAILFPLPFTLNPPRIATPRRAGSLREQNGRAAPSSGGCCKSRAAGGMRLLWVRGNGCRDGPVAGDWPRRRETIQSPGISGRSSSRRSGSGIARHWADPGLPSLRRDRRPTRTPARKSAARAMRRWARPPAWTAFDAGRSPRRGTGGRRAAGTGPRRPLSPATPTT